MCCGCQFCIITPCRLLLLALLLLWGMCGAIRPIM
jgi:hypothetical protein